MYLNKENMGLFERALGLTLTWDVFKLKLLLLEKRVNTRLTLTWDVFKLYFQ